MNTFKRDEINMSEQTSCGALLPYWARIVLAATLGMTLILIFLLVPILGYPAYIGIIIALMIGLSISGIEKCWTWKRLVLQLAPYVGFSVVMILVVILTSGGSLQLLGMTPTQQFGIGYDLTYGFTNFWGTLTAAVVSGGVPTINFTASIVMYGVAAFMLVYGDRMENDIIMLGGTLMMFAPMILGFVTVLLTQQPVGFFAIFASGFLLFGPAGVIVMAIICIIPDALIISVLMTIERLIPEPEEVGSPSA